jgi:hypothetical protein
MESRVGQIIVYRDFCDFLCEAHASKLHKSGLEGNAVILLEFARPQKIPNTQIHPHLTHSRNFSNIHLRSELKIRIFALN